MTDKDQAVMFPFHGDGLPDRLETFDDFNQVEDRPPALPASLVSLGFIKAAIRRSWRFWGALAIVGLVVGVGVSVKYPASYKASTSVLITYGPNDNPTSAVLDNQAIAESESVAALALQKLGLTEPVGTFAATITASVVTTRVLVIAVSAPSSAEAVSRANAVAAAFLQFRAQQMQAAQRLLIESLNQELDQAKQTVKSLNSQISQVQAEPSSASQQSRLKNLKSQATQAAYQVSVDEQTAAGAKANTAIQSAVTGSVVLDHAIPLAHSKLKYLLIYAVTGLAVGLALGLGIVVVRAIVSDRLRRRDDIMHAIEAPVKLTVGKVRLSRWRPGHRGLAAANDGDVRRIVAYLRRAIQATDRGTALAVVPVDDPGVAALSLVALALSRAQEGHKVVLADLASGAPAAALLDTKASGVRSVNVQNTQLVVAVPDRDDIAPVGPFGRAAGQNQRSDFTEAVAGAYASADVLLSLVTLDPAFGGEHLPTWASSAVAMVTVGRSSWARIHAVGEMIRLSGTSLISAVLVGADKTDESMGVTEHPGALTSTGDMG